MKAGVKIGAATLWAGSETVLAVDSDGVARAMAELPPRLSAADREKLLSHMDRILDLVEPRHTGLRAI